MIDIEELKRLAGRATPGPWHADDGAASGFDGSWDVAGSDYCGIASMADTAEVAKLPRDPRSNAEYIAAACNSVPELIAEIERLRNAYEKLEIRLGLKGEGGINITDGIPSEIYIGIGRGYYDSDYELASDVADTVRVESRSHIERLTIALADAMRSPIGVMPDSAANLIASGDLAAAEARQAPVPVPDHNRRKSSGCGNFFGTSSGKARRTTMVKTGRPARSVAGTKDEHPGSLSYIRGQRAGHKFDCRIAAAISATTDEVRPEPQPTCTDSPPPETPGPGSGKA